MSDKEELNEEDLDFLKELFGESKKVEKGVPEKLAAKDIKDDMIKLDGKTEKNTQLGAIKLELEKADLNSHDFEARQVKYSSKKKRKIKKKELFLEIAEALSLIKQNNILLNKLIQALIQEPIKVKLLKE